MTQLPTRLKEALIAQAKIEIEASLLYEAASQWFAEKHLGGIAAKLRGESAEEFTHYKMILDYITVRGDSQTLLSPEISSGQNWTEELQVFEFFLEVERNNYRSLCEVFKIARVEGDPDAERFMQTMIDEQVKSVFEWDGHVEKMKTFTAMPGLIWHFDAIIK